MTVGWSKRRSLLTLTFIVKSISKNLLIRIIELSWEIKVCVTIVSFWKEGRGAKFLNLFCSTQMLTSVRRMSVTPTHGVSILKDPMYVAVAEDIRETARLVQV